MAPLAAPAEVEGEANSGASSVSGHTNNTMQSAFSLGSHSIAYADLPDEAKELHQTFYNIKHYLLSLSQYCHKPGHKRPDCPELAAEKAAALAKAAADQNSTTNQIQMASMTNSSALTPDTTSGLVFVSVRSAVSAVEILIK